MSHKYPKPKCLVLHIDDEILPENLFKSLLEYAWSKNFLDFTTIGLNVSDKSNYITDSII